jgi:O-antigen ligase
MTAPTYGPLPHAAGQGAAGAPRPGLSARLSGAVAAAGATPRVLVLVLAAFLVVNFARAHEMVPQLAVLRLGRLSGIPLVFLALQRLPRRQLRGALRTGPGRGMLFIAAMMLLSVPFSIWRGNSFGYIKGTGLISYIMFVTTAGVLVDRAAVPTVLRTVTLAVAAGATRMLLPGAPVYMEGDIPRALFSYTYDPNDTAALFLVCIPLALYLANRAGARAWLWYGSALVMVLGMVRTGSRGGLLGLGAMVATLVVLAPPRLRGRLCGAAAAAVLAFGVVVQGNAELRDRFMSTFSSEQTDYNYTAANGRIEIWKRGLRYMVTHPLTGVGIANFTTAELVIGSEIKRQKGIYSKHMFTAHNSLIQIGAELGIPGFCAYLFVFGSAMAGLLRVRRRALAAARGGLAAALDTGALASAVMTSLVALFVGGMFLSLAYSPITLFTFAMCAALIAAAPAALSTAAGGAAAAPAAPPRPPGRRGGLAHHGVPPRVPAAGR